MLPFLALLYISLQGVHHNHYNRIQKLVHNNPASPNSFPKMVSVNKSEMEATSNETDNVFLAMDKVVQNPQLAKKFKVRAVLCL